MKEFCMQFHSHANQSHFHKNGFALRLALKQRHTRTRKWPIGRKWMPKRWGAWRTILHSNLQRHKLYDSVSSDVDYFAHIKFLMSSGKPTESWYYAYAPWQRRFCFVGFPLKSVTLCPRLESLTLQVHHKVLDVISFLNSSQNPLMYWYDYEEHKRELFKLFWTCKMPIVPSLEPQGDSFYIGCDSRLKTRTSKLRTQQTATYNYHQCTTVKRAISYRVFTHSVKVAELRNKQGIILDISRVSASWTPYLRTPTYYSVHYIKSISPRTRWYASDYINILVTTFW